MPINLSEHYTTMFAGHTLAVIVDEGQALCWRLEKEPGRRAYMVEVSVTPEGIHIMGDTIPGHDRAGVQAKKSLAWWVSEVDANYLAHNFLTKQWVPQAGDWRYQTMRGALKARQEEGADLSTYLVKLKQCLQNNDNPYDSLLSWQRTFGEVIDALVDNDILDTSECYPNQIYEPGEVALLAAIHDRFRACFMEQYVLVDGQPRRKE